MDNIVTCEQLSKVYRQGKIDVNALSDVNLQIERGDFVCLSGPSGSGKSTLLNMIGGLDQPTSGTIILDDMRIDLLSQSELAVMRLHKIGFIFQSYNLIPVLTAQENVEMVMQLQGVERHQRHARAKTMLHDVGLAGLEKRRPAELSGGQQQRVAVARAIVTNQSLVLADEPTANLDHVTAHKLLDLMREMNEQRNVTFIISTHDPKIMQRSKRLIYMEDGRITNNELQEA